jgi:hypothetical protein
MKHLWEYQHPHYAPEGERFDWPSWEEFATKSAFATGDRRQNLLIGWDWRKPEVPDFREWVLLLTGVLPGRNRMVSHAINVMEAEEPVVRWFLAERAVTMREMWAPLL